MLLWSNLSGKRNPGSLVARVLVFPPGSTYTECDHSAGNLNPSSREVEAIGSEVQGHLWLRGGSGAGLGGMHTTLSQKIK